MNYKVKNPFILNNKTFLSGAEVSDDLFAGQESIKSNLLRLGFLVPVSPVSPVSPEVQPSPSQEQKSSSSPISQAIEIKSDADLKKAVEGQSDNKEPVVTPEIPSTTTSKKTRGKAERAA